jgi:hypothetical protein
VTYKNKIKSEHLLATKFTSITKMHGATHIKITIVFIELVSHTENQTTNRLLKKRLGPVINNVKISWEKLHKEFHDSQ